MGERLSSAFGYGGPDAGLSGLGAIIRNAPCNAMRVMPSLGMVRRNTTVRIDALTETTPTLREPVAAPAPATPEQPVPHVLPRRPADVERAQFRRRPARYARPTPLAGGAVVPE